MTQGSPSPDSITTSSFTTTRLPISKTVPEIDQHLIAQYNTASLTDTIAAVTIAVLACILLIIVTLTVRAVHRRRRRRRGQQLNVIATVSAGIASASVNAYRIRSTPQPASNNSVNWESVTPSSSSADVAASSAVLWLPNSYDSPLHIPL